MSLPSAKDPAGDRNSRDQREVERLEALNRSPTSLIARYARSFARTAFARRRLAFWSARRPAQPKLAEGERRLAERVGFEPTCRLPDKSLSRRSRYDHFGTSPQR